MNGLLKGRDEAGRLAQASSWRVHLTEHDLETSEEFESWLSADPRNEVAWDHVQAGWLYVCEYANSPELLKIRRDALDGARRQSRLRWVRPARHLALAACLALMLLTGLSSGIWWHLQPMVYRTAMGERRSITLGDGSRASLDVGTELTVRYTESTRKLELIRGQARFDVTHDATRPFLVQARDRTIIATGTAFNVDLLGPKVLVTLIEGHVVVVDKQSHLAPLVAFKTKPADAIELAPGQRLVATASLAPVVESASVERASAWEGGMLEFDDEPLSAVVERVSRYSMVPVTVAPQAANMRISGVFKAGDIETFIEIVTRYLPVEARRTANQTVIQPKSRPE